MNAGFRFLYLNFYAVLLLLLGAAVAAVPLYRITALFLFIQIPTALLCSAVVPYNGTVSFYPDSDGSSLYS